MKMVQVDLTRTDGKQMTTWVEKKPLLAAGAMVSVKEGDVSLWWRVERVYSTVMENTDLEKNRGWDNNNYDKHESKSLKDRLK